MPLLPHDRGVQTVVGGFGYGGSGSLGTGYTALSFVPVKTRMPKCEPVVEISGEHRVR